MIFLIATNCFAVTNKEAFSIYNKLTKANNLFPIKLRVISGQWVNAEYTGYNIEITQAAVRLPASQVAFILGHELAHMYLHHWKSSYKTEYEADQQGAYFAAQAGFNRCQGVKVLLTFNGSDTHPPGIDRYNKVRCK